MTFHQRRYWGVFTLLILLTALGSLSLDKHLAFRIFAGVLVIPDLIAIPLLYRVVLEFHKGSRMRLAWILMIWSAGFSATRHLLDFLLSFTGSGSATPVRNMFLIPLLLSLIAQLLSMTLLLACFRGLGIQRPLTWTHRMLVVILMAFIVFCMIESRSLPQAAAPFAFFRYLGFLNAVVFAAGTVVGLLLYRLSEDIGASDLGLSILFLVLQLVARITGFVLETVNRRFQMPSLVHVSNIFYWMAPWLFLWAILFRWQVIGSAMRTTQLRGVSRRENVA